MHSTSDHRPAFTLVELMIVVLIIGILAVLVIPSYSRSAGNARQEAFLANLRDLGQMATLYHQEWNELPAQGAGDLIPEEMLTEVGRRSFPLVTPLGGYWHIGDLGGGRWGVGIWWSADQDGATILADCEAIDAAYDDGNRATGRFVCDEGTSRYYWLIE